MLIFLCFRPEVHFYLEICSKNQYCLLKLKFRIQINLNMQNSMVIFIFQFGNTIFCVNFIQKFKRVILRRNLVPTLEYLIDVSPLINFLFFSHPEHSFSTPSHPLLPPFLLIIGKRFKSELERIYLCRLFCDLAKGVTGLQCVLFCKFGQRSQQNVLFYKLV